MISRRKLLVGASALVLSCDGTRAQGWLPLAGPIIVNYPGSTFHRAYNMAKIPANASYFTSYGRVRPYEPLRTQLIVRNLGSTVLDLGYNTTATNNNTFAATNFTTPGSLNPGQEYRENSDTNQGRMIFVRPHTSGQGGNYSTYVEIGGSSVAGSSVIQAITPTPIGVPCLSVSTYQSSAVPCGLSKDRATVYCSNGTSTLYQTINDGGTFTSVAAPGGIILGLRETDDGEATLVTQDGAAQPGYIFKSTGWSTSHTGATWALVKTSVSKGYFREIWGGASFSNFGRNDVGNTGKYGVLAEYGNQLASGLDPTYPTHIYFTSDYGQSFSQILDIQTYPPFGYPMHTKAAAYDPYWDRIWVSADNPWDTTHVAIVYSDDHGATWNQFFLPVEFQNDASDNNFDSNQIAPLEARIIFGNDHTNGYWVIPRVGYRVMGAAFLSLVASTHTGAQQTNFAAFRSAPGQQLFACLGNTGGGMTVPAIYADQSDGGKTLTELWRDDTQPTAAVSSVFGPTVSGKLFASLGATILIGTIVQGVQGQFDQSVVVTGDGATLAFTFPHFLSYTPTTLLCYKQNIGAVGVALPAMSADGTNITLTFSVAPVNATTYAYALRYA